MALAPQEPVVASDNGGTAMPKAKRLTYKVKLEVVQKPGGSIDITTSLYRILCAIRNADSSTDFVDIKGNKVILSSFKYERASFDAAFGLTSVGGARPKVWVNTSYNSDVLDSTRLLHNYIQSVISPTHSFARNCTAPTEALRISWTLHHGHDFASWDTFFMYLLNYI